MPTFKDTLPDYEPASVEALEQWLAQHHATSPGIWLVRWKKGTGGPQITYDQVVEACLIWRWIDSVPRKLDAQRYRTMLTPRKPGSVWSAANKARVQQLQAQGRFMPPGWAKVLQAQADGSWHALNASDSLELPPDLATALAQNPQAEAYFQGFSASSRKNILAYILAGGRPH